MIIFDKIKKYLCDKDSKEIIKGSFFAFLFRIGGIVVSYIFIVAISKIYGANALGRFSLSFTLLQIITVFSKLGMDNALLRYISQFAGQKKYDQAKLTFLNCLKIVLPISIVLTIISLLLSPVIAKYIFNKTYLGTYFQTMFLGVPALSSLFLIRESLRGLRKIKIYVFLQNISIYTFSLILVAILYFTKSRMDTAVNFCFVVSIYISAIIGYVWLYNNLKKYKILSVIKGEVNLKEIISISLPMLISNSLLLIMGWTDVIMLGILRTEKDVGIYNVILKSAMFLLIPLMAVSTISAPKISEAYWKGDKKIFESVVRKSTKLIFFTSFPIVILVMLFPNVVLSIFGQEFTTGSVALIILSIGQFIASLTGLGSDILKMTGKERVFQNIIFVAVMLNIFLNILLISMWGINGASLASAISIIFLNVTSVIYIKLYYGVYAFYTPFRIKSR